MKAHQSIAVLYLKGSWPSFSQCLEQIAALISAETSTVSCEQWENGEGLLNRLNAQCPGRKLDLQSSEDDIGGQLSRLLFRKDSSLLNSYVLPAH